MRQGIIGKRIENDIRLNTFRAIRDQSRLPYYRALASAVDPITVIDRRPRLMFGSNNYLGLSNHPEVVRAARNAVERFGGSTTGTPPLSGTMDLRLQLERDIADWHGTEDSLVFASGYQANLGTIAALVGVGDTILIDTEAHASIHDGARLSGASVRTFPHNDVAALRANLRRVVDRPGAVLVVIDGLYSMHGDLAPLDDIVSACTDFAVPVMIDEAHSVGVLGANRTGAAELYAVDDRIDIRMGALSKALGSTGGFVAGTRALTDALRLNARAFLFSTAAVPAAIGAADAAVRIARSDEGTELADAALRNAKLLRQRLGERGIATGGTTRLPDGTTITAPNVSVLTGAEERAIRVWQRIFDDGVFCALAVEPAVKPGGALLRLSVMATHTGAQIECAANTVATALIETTPGDSRE